VSNMHNLVLAEKQLDCRRLIYHFDIERAAHQCSIELYARVVFILVDNLAEGMDETEPTDYYQQQMIEYYHESSLLYGENPDYLFLMGFIISKGEWCFRVSLSDAILMRKQPYQMQPGNRLYEWLSLNHGDPNLREVAKQLVEKRPECFVWLESLGVLGQYIIDIIEANAEGR